MRINNEITVRKVRLINQNSEQVGIVAIDEALRLSENAGCDLVEVSPNANPPVCKIMDFGKYKYELAKKEKETKKKQHVIVTKEIRLRPKIEEHDFEFKARHARKFLESGNRVKATIMFRGRERVHQEYGVKILDRLREELDDIAKVEKEPKMESGQLIMYLTKK
ncbi:translation initiation factor IF-3 [candidate division KSB1 bacterium]|nr:translation initiation factor IF-3 [candidate division KSB1 bacterium]